MINPEKIVSFHEYCPRCEYFSRAETEDPCYECLSSPTNTYSHKPVLFRAKSKSTKKEVYKKNM